MDILKYFTEHYVERLYGVTYILTELFSCLSISILFEDFSFKKLSSWIRLLIDFAATWVVYLIYNSFLTPLLSLGDGSMMRYLRYFTWVLTAFSHVLYPYKNHRLRNRITGALAISMFIELTISISGCLGGMVTKAFGTPESLLVDTTFYLVSALLIIVTIIFKVLSPFKYHYGKLAPCIVIDIVFSLGFFLTPLLEIVMSATDSTGDHSGILVVTFFMTYVLCYLCYIIYYLNAKSYNEVIAYQTRALKAESEKKQLEISDSKYVELHQIRHDIKNQMQLLNTLLKEKKYEEAEEYLADINEKYHIVIDYYETGNTFLSAVLNMELAKAKKNGLSLDGKVSVPSQLNIVPGDLVSLVSNLIDNAIEASLRYDIKEPIQVSMFYEEPYLFITIANALPENIQEKDIFPLHSKKNNVMNHGYGVKIINEICKAYDGQADFHLADHRFVFDGMLNLSEKKEEEAK